jgi:exodeoxyribonuclease V alpha subunit
MSENPYRLARDIRGIGFKTADAIAMKLGIDKSAMIRVRAGISYALTEAMDEGHCGLPTAELLPLAEKLLEVPVDLVRTAIDLELADGTVIADSVGQTPCVFLAGLHRAERTIAERLLRLANGTLPWPWIDPQKALPWVEARIGLALADSQVSAIRLALMSKVLVTTGGPGVGKTTIVNAILRIVAAKGVRLVLCAPTGRAAKRMMEATGFEAKTIHRLLEVDPRGGGFRRGDDNPLDCDLLVIDETSMVDVLLMQALMRAVPDKAAVLIVGDIDQGSHNFHGHFMGVGQIPHKSPPRAAGRLRKQSPFQALQQPSLRLWEPIHGSPLGPALPLWTSRIGLLPGRGNLHGDQRPFADGASGSGGLTGLAVLFFAGLGGRRGRRAKPDRR